MKVLSAAAGRPEEPSEPQAFAFGPFRLEVAARELRRDGVPVALAPKAFDTLLLLVRGRHRVLTKEELIRSVWPDSFVTEDSLTQNIWALRRALGDASNQPRFISTVPRVGYRFVAPVQELGQSLPAEAGSHVLSTPAVEETVTPVPLPADTSVAGTVVTSPSSVASPNPVASGFSRKTPWRPALLGALAGGALVALILVATRPAPAPPAPMRFVQAAPAGTALASGGVLSPDGRRIAFVARDEQTGTSQLWVRDMDAAAARPLAGTEDAARPFWSPDAQQLGFFADGKLKAVGVAGEPPRTIATVGARSGAASWGSAGAIIWGDRRSGLFAVPATGGAITAVTALDPAGPEAAHRWPSFLPDGRRFLYHVVSGDPARAGLYVGSIDATAPVRVLDGNSAPAIYAPSGHLLFVREGALMAQPFDVDALRATGTPQTIAANVPAPSLISGTVISASMGGLVAFGGGGGTERLAWFSRTGDRLGGLETPTTLHNVTLSPDGRLLLADSVDADRRGIWVVDLERGAATRVHHDGVIPAWSPDGSRIAFTSSRAGSGHIYVRPTTGEGRDEILLETPEAKTVEDWSRDGRHLVYSSASRDTRQDLWVLPLPGATPRPLVQSAANEMYARLSPDGGWIAYMSDESGDWEVYLQAFPGGGRKRTISAGGGSHPQWRADGRELFYLAADRTLMSVAFTAGPQPSVGRPRALFRTRVTGDATAYRTPYAVSADASRFLIDSIDDVGQLPPITVMVNWTSRLRP